MAQTPVSLLDRLRNGRDVEDWTSFVAWCSPLLLRQARSIVPQEADAQDLVQEVLTTLVQKLPTFEHNGPGSFRAWLRTILNNQWRTWNRRRRPALLEPEKLQQFAANEGQSPLDETTVYLSLISAALERLREKFEPKTWQAFKSTTLDNRPCAEVAEELGMSINSLYLARSRVLKLLREELRELGE